MRFRFKPLLAAAAALTGLSLASLPVLPAANAATPSCGKTCVDVFNHDFGTHKAPDFVMDVLRQGEKVGQPVILFRQANSDPAEDFTVADEGLVSDFYAARLVSAALNLHYGCNWNPATSTCGNTSFPDDYAFEVEYAPYGVQSGLCAGVASTAVGGEKVSLQPCGVSADTVWVIDQADSSTGHMTPVLDEYVPLINGSDTNFSHPFVMEYPAAAYPTDSPRPQIQVNDLTGSSTGTKHDPAGVNSNQLWGADLGVLN